MKSLETKLKRVEKRINLPFMGIMTTNIIYDTYAVFSGANLQNTVFGDVSFYLLSFFVVLPTVRTVLFTRTLDDHFLREKRKPNPIVI